MESLAVASLSLCPPEARLNIESAAPETCLNIESAEAWAGSCVYCSPPGHRNSPVAQMRRQSALKPTTCQTGFSSTVGHRESGGTMINGDYRKRELSAGSPVGGVVTAPP
ncbi:hypothetical protein AAFF_G00104750 [Aldrovandia affinis]|uniref:Uncharacterized protein n=1 Tax=Aldrovandia affinis TaxID=143900 RepID=A0AAD7T2N3_9TELE|nr:hypothetical protein AAFF_G00104750 [Aldrovandia affinis]